MKKRRVSILLLVIALTIATGFGIDRWRAHSRTAESETTKSKLPPLPQWGELLPSGETAEVVGIAKCGYCYWGEGGSSCNTVLQTKTEPGIVFLLPNEKRAELEKTTGKCAGGKYQVRARGAVTQYDGRNYMLVKNFETQRIE